jgi:hypothetical protein
MLSRPGSSGCVAEPASGRESMAPGAHALPNLRWHSVSYRGGNWGGAAIMDSGTESRTSPIERIVFQARTSAAEAFDSAHGNALDDTVAEIGKVYNLLLIWVLNSTEGLSARFDAVALVNRAFDILVSSLHMIRQRAPLESLILLRACIETTAASLHIYFDEETRAKYFEKRAAKYGSTRSIAFANQYCPRIAELWGALSEAAVHVNEQMHGPDLKLEQGKVVRVVHVGSRRENVYGEVKWLLLIKLVANHVLRALELVLLEHDATGGRWKAVAGSNMRYYCATEDTIDRLFAEFTTISG